MSQYIMRKGRLFYEIAKFEDSDSPTAVYLFTKRGCNCPASRNSCKHSKILKSWQQSGEILGAVYDDLGNHISTLNI